MRDGSYRVIGLWGEVRKQSKSSVQLPGASVGAAFKQPQRSRSPDGPIFFHSLFKSTVAVDNRWLKRLFQSLPLLTTLLSLLLLSLAACKSSSARQPRQLTTEEQQGRGLFQANCAICHNAYKKEPLQGPPLVDLFRKEAMPSGIPATDEHVRDTIITGRRNMPPFRTMLDDTQIEELMAFLHTL